MIVTIGEALVDLIEHADGRFEACLGGSVCNFTLGLARQGAAVTYLNPLSTDKFGARFLALLGENGIGLASPASTRPTALAVVSLDANGSPSYAFYREAVADRDITAEELVAAMPAGVRLLHTGGLALVPDDMEKVFTSVAAAKARGALVSMDVNLRPLVVKAREAYIDGVRRAMRLAHIVKVSDEDADVLGLAQPSARALADGLLRDSELELIAYTRGARGAALLTRTAQVELPVPRGLAVADTVGAGDCFHAGLIAFLQRAGKLDAVGDLAALDEATLRGALRHAIAAASLNIMRVGCDPASWEQTVQFQAQQAD